MMAVIPLSAQMLDDFTMRLCWGTMAAGDSGEPAQILPYPYATMSYTGCMDNVADKAYPIVDIYGTIEDPDSLCWGLLFTIMPPPDMFYRLSDPIIRLDDYPRVCAIKPIVRPGSNLNTVSILGLAARPWGFRS
jgi:hypothetical protein